MPSVVPIFDERSAFIGVWAAEEDFVPTRGSLRELGGLAEPTLTSLTQGSVVRTQITREARAGKDLRFECGVFLMLGGEKAPPEEFKSGGSFAAFNHQGTQIIKRQTNPAPPRPDRPVSQNLPFYETVTDDSGRVVGIWVADPSHPNLQARIEMLIASTDTMTVEHYAAFKQGHYTTISNTSDNRGGAFLMFGAASPPLAEAASAGKKWWRFWA